MNRIPIRPLETEVAYAVAELLACNIYHKPQYSPALRNVGMRLDEALQKRQTDITDVSMRPDVAAFAAKMSAVMTNKAAEKGEPNQERRDTSLMLLMRNTKRLEETLNNPTELRKVLIHIANFAMIAESNIKE